MAKKKKRDFTQYRGKRVGFEPRFSILLFETFGKSFYAASLPFPSPPTEISSYL